MTPLAVLSAAHRPHEAALLAYITARTPATEWRRADQLARRAWEYALAHLDMSDPTRDDDAGLPAWLAAAARTVIRRHRAVGADRTVDWPHLERLLGRAETWPPHWSLVLATAGQDALLAQADADFVAAYSSTEPAFASAA
ncbi:hypothetical protein WDH52_06375 [Streptomyces sp. TRM70308]|uniref:hypothetical protein n=1 Tax=Streptomyces sp. TRM70308 TaxID=3131932 RepID=UPI003CFCD0AF